MYSKINKKFLEGSNVNQNRGVLITIPLVCAIVAGLIIYFCKIDVFNSYFALILSSVIYVACTLFLIYFYIIDQIKDNEEFSFKKLLNFKQNVILFVETLHDKDIKLLIEILKENGINTRPKVHEVLHHYQCLLPRRTIESSQIMAILAFTVSVLTLILQNEVLLNQYKMAVIVMVILVVVLFYLIWNMMNRNIFRAFGKDAFNERMESALSEIWIKQLIK